MGLTLWIRTLQGRDMSKDSDDHSLMYDHSDALDKLCNQLGVPTLSSFFDLTDMEHNFPEDDDEDMEDPHVDSETGLAYGIDDMKWFDSSQGITTLTALRSHIKDKGIGRLSDEDKQGLLEEIDDCLERLELAKPGKFHLALIG